MRFPNMNFHTHTTYCDGKETAEQMVQAAIAKGFTRQIGRASCRERVYVLV